MKTKVDLDLIWTRSQSGPKSGPGPDLDRNIALSHLDKKLKGLSTWHVIKIGSESNFIEVA